MRRLSGFTLIEVLVAIALLAVVGVLGYRGLDHIRLSSAAIAGEAERWQRLGGVFARLGHDLNQVLSPALDPEREFPFWLLEPVDRAAGRGQELSFLRPAPASGEAQRIAYRFERAPGGQGEFSLLIWHGREAGPSHRRVVLLDQLENVEMAGLDRRGQWWSQWPSAWRKEMPRALRIVLTLANQQQIERIFDLPAAD